MDMGSYPQRPADTNVPAIKAAAYCPACNKPLGKSVVLVCGACWLLVPTNDRVALYSMYRRRQDVTTKLEKIVRNLKARQAASTNAKPGA